MKSKPTDFRTSHVVSNEVGTILGVYGSALLAEAQELARRIEYESGCPTYLHSVVGPRPTIEEIEEMAAELREIIPGEGDYGQARSVIQARWGLDYSANLFAAAVERADELRAEGEGDVS